MSHQINKDAIREAIGLDEEYYVAIWRADGHKDKQLNKVVLSSLIAAVAPVPAALTKVDDTNVTLTLGGSPSTSVLAATSITVGWTGTLADGRIASAATWNAKIGGSGTTNYVAKFTASGTIGNSLIRDDGSTIGVNNAPDASYKVYINSDKLVGLGVFNNAASGSNNFGIAGSATNANSASNIGVFGSALLSTGGTNLGVRGQSASQAVTDSTSIVSAGSNIGGFFQANASSATSYGIVASADATSNQASATFIGALIRANNAGTKYAVQLIDGTEGSGKFLKSVTSSGHGNWASLAITDVTASLGSALQYVRVNAGGTALEYATLTTNNLGNSDLTSTTNARYFKLNGDATTNLLRVQNNSNQNIVQFRGDRSILIDGYTTNGFVKTSAGTGLITVSTQVSATEGGTGRSSWTANSLVYIGATNTFGEILAGTNGNVLTMVAGTPAWAALSVSLTSQVTGVLPIANGGTNLSALGSALQYLRVNSLGTALEYATLSAPNIYTASDTITDDARTVTLKTGTTTTQNLAILTGAGGNLSKWMGNGQIDMGSTSYYVQPNIYLNPASPDQFIIYRGSTGLLYLDPLSYDLAMIGTSGQRVTIHANAGSIDARSDSSAYYLLTSAGTNRAGFILQSGASGLYMNNASGTRIVNIETQNGYGTIVGSWAVGLSHSTAPSGRLHVKGPGSTSATTTALFQNNNASPILTLKDDLSIQEGDSTNFVTHKVYTDPTVNDNVIIYAGTNGWTYFQSQARNVYLYGTTTGVIGLNAQTGKISATGTDGGFRAINESGIGVGTLETEGSGGWFFLANSSGTKKVEFYVPGNQYYMVDGCSFGYAASTPAAVIDAKGKGSTSATTTALFQNSASVAALTIKDDLTSTFGGIVTVPQIITTPATITVTANAGTVTRANRINKFTNSSAATMTITMSTTAALDGDMVQVRIYDFSAAAQTITWVNTENSSVTVPATSNGSTTLPLTVGFQYNSATSKWRCIGSV